MKMTEVEKERPDDWMIKPCDMYKDEHVDCTSLHGRFHQYFVHGTYADCSHWRTDFDNCTKWITKRDENAYKNLIESEKTRRLARLAPHYQNTVWKHRENPPENWNAPLPEWMEKKFENTYLDHINKENKEILNTKKQSQCIIM